MRTPISHTVGRALGVLAVIGAMAMPPAMADYPPTPNIDTPTAPAPKPLEVGQLTVMQNGVPVTVTQSTTESAVTLSGNGWSITIGALSNGGQPLQMTADGHIVIPQTGGVSLDVAGFDASSVVALYLYSNPLFLGELKIDAQGHLIGAIPVPADAPTGGHTLQIVGQAPSGASRVLAIGVFVRPVKISATAKRYTLANLHPVAKAKVQAGASVKLEAELLRLIDGRHALASQVKALEPCAMRVKVVLDKGNRSLLSRGCLKVDAKGHGVLSWKAPSGVTGAAHAVFSIVDKGRPTNVVSRAFTFVK